MKIYWSTNSIPELQAYPKTEHRSLIKRATKENYKNKLVWLGYILLFMGIFSASIFISSASNLLFGMLIGGAMGGIIGLLSTQILFAAIRPTLARYRRELEQASAPTNNDYFVPHAL